MLVTMTTQHSWYKCDHAKLWICSMGDDGNLFRVGGRGGHHSSWSRRAAQLPHHGPQLHTLAAHGDQVDMEHNAVYIVYSLDLCKPENNQQRPSSIVSWGRPWLLDPQPSAHPASDLSSARKFPTIMCRFPDDSRPVTR